MYCIDGVVILGDAKLQHVAIIMDGNGRWAESRGLSRTEGHARGVEAIIATIVAAKEQGIPYLTLFAFGQDNWQRPQAEVDGLISLGIKALGRYIKFLVENKIKIRFIGDIVNIPLDLRLKIKFAQTATAMNKGIEVLIAFNYSGLWDISNAAVEVCKNNRKLDTATMQEAIPQYLQASYIPNPDLLIRTGGEIRISNFYLWQLAYTELYFTELKWPDFNAAALQDAVTEFHKRHRRFGMTMQQVEDVKN